MLSLFRSFCFILRGNCRHENRCSQAHERAKCDLFLQHGQPPAASASEVSSAHCASRGPNRSASSGHSPGMRGIVAGIVGGGGELIEMRSKVRRLRNRRSHVGLSGGPSVRAATWQVANAGRSEPAGTPAVQRQRQEKARPVCGRAFLLDRSRLRRVICRAVFYSVFFSSVFFARHLRLGLPEVRIGLDPAIVDVALLRAEDEKVGHLFLDRGGGKFAELLHAVLAHRGHEFRVVRRRPCRFPRRTSSE